MAPFDRDSLIAAAQEAEQGGGRLKYLFFWSDKPRHPGAGLGPECFSQWYGAPFTLEGRLYPTAEHWMMAQKARLFGDKRRLEKILAAKSPGEAKALGREVRGFDPARWEAERERIVFSGNLEKFGQNPALGAFLLGTGERVLAEASPRDAIWGIGLARDHPDAERPAAWPGLNLLGFALMRARQALREGDH